MLSSTPRWLTFVTAALLVIAVWVGSTAVSAASHAQIRGTSGRPINHVLGPQAGQQSYSIIDLGTLGGKSSTANGINDRDWVTGVANLPGDDSQHAVLWTPKHKIDLGTLGGPNSAVFWPIKADTGAIAGISETSAMDPLRQNFCFGTSHICLGFLWRNGAMISLPTLGGNNSYATAVNDRGQVAGLAENRTRDPNCIAPQSLDFEGVIWGPSKGQMQVLPPLAGDASAGAVAINNRGQAVGASGICQNPSPAAHAVLWQNGSVMNLGTLGGKKGNLATAINNRGEIAGFSDLAGDDTSHAFLWRNGVMTDLGILPGDFSSAAFGINDKSQVVGNSCNQSGDCRAFLWQNGVMTDLNILIRPSSSLFPTFGGDINSRGEIVGEAFDQRTRQTHAFVAIPHASEYLSAAQVLNQTRRVILPESVRKMLRRHRGFGRFQLLLTRTQ